MTTGEGKGGRGREREGEGGREKERDRHYYAMTHNMRGRKKNACNLKEYLCVATVYPIHVHSVHYYTGECEREKRGTVTAKYSSLPQPQQGSGGVSHQWCFL